MNQHWIGVDLDGTLAHYEGWKGSEHIGEPIPAMVERIKRWAKEGMPVKIVTARVYCGESGSDAADGERYRDAQYARALIEKWCLKHIGFMIPVTCCKDYGMITLWDDRAVRVVINTGEVDNGYRE